MTKLDIITEVSQGTGLTKVEVEAVLDGDLDSLMEAFLQWQRSQRDSEKQT